MCMPTDSVSLTEERLDQTPTTSLTDRRPTDRSTDQPLAQHPLVATAAAVGMGQIQVAGIN